MRHGIGMPHVSPFLRDVGISTERAECNSQAPCSLLSLSTQSDDLRFGGSPVVDLHGAIQFPGGARAKRHADRATGLGRQALAALRLPRSLRSWSWRRSLGSQSYATTAEAFSTDCFAGAKATSTTPTIANTTTPTSSRRSITFRYSCAAITPACARFAHPPKAIRLRFAAGSRTASSKKIPSVT